MTNPVIITLAINGETSKKRNPHVPHKPEEIVADAVACFGAGVAVLHNHMGDINMTGRGGRGALCARVGAHSRSGARCHPVSDDPAGTGSR